MVYIYMMNMVLMLLEAPKWSFQNELLEAPKWSFQNKLPGSAS